jgi:hypothetical protein
MHHIESFQQLGALYTRFHLQPRTINRDGALRRWWCVERVCDGDETDDRLAIAGGDRETHLLDF